MAKCSGFKALCWWGPYLCTNDLGRVSLCHGDSACPGVGRTPGPGMLGGGQAWRCGSHCTRQEALSEEDGRATHGNGTYNHCTPPSTAAAPISTCPPRGMRGIRRKIALNHSEPVPSADYSLRACCHHGAIPRQHVPIHSSVRLALLGSGCRFAHDGGSAPGHRPHRHPRTDRFYPTVAHPYQRV